MRWIISTIILAFGIFTLDFDKTKFLLLGLFLYSLPIICQFFRSDILRYWAIWFGVFLMIQSLVTPIVLDLNYHTLPANMNQIVNIESGYEGISGKQTITTDEKGFRTTKEIDYNSANTYRIFAIGGSTTEQLSLDDKSTWTHLLQEKLSSSTKSNIEVINTGLSGLRAENHLSTLRNILPYHPDMVLFLVGINDWNWHIKHRNENQLEIALKKVRHKLLFSRSIFGKTIKNLQSLSGNNSSAKNERIDNGEYYNDQRGSLNRKEKIEFKPKNVHPQYKKYLEEINEICTSNNLTCVFATQPSGYQSSASEAYKNSFWMTPPNEYGKRDANYTLTFDSMIHIANLYNNYLISFSKENNQKSCDTASGINASFDFFHDDCHFNVNGANRMSDLLNACIVDLI